MDTCRYMGYVTLELISVKFNKVDLVTCKAPQRGCELVAGLDELNKFWDCQAGTLTDRAHEVGLPDAWSC